MKSLILIASLLSFSATAGDYEYYEDEDVCLAQKIVAEYAIELRQAGVTLEAARFAIDNPAHEYIVTQAYRMMAVNDTVAHAGIVKAFAGAWYDGCLIGLDIIKKRGG